MLVPDNQHWHGTGSASHAINFHNQIKVFERQKSPLVPEQLRARHSDLYFLFNLAFAIDFSPNTACQKVRLHVMFSGNLFLCASDVDILVFVVRSQSFA
jgi:hypothetical protein